VKKEEEAVSVHVSLNANELLLRIRIRKIYSGIFCTYKEFVLVTEASTVDKQNDSDRTQILKIIKI